MCLFDHDGQRELKRIELPEYTNEIWHGYVPEHRAVHRLRLSRARTVRAGRGASLQPEQAAARSVRARAHRRADLESGLLRLHHRRRRRRPVVRQARQRALRPEVRRRRSELRLARRAEPPSGAVGPHRALRDARARLHQAASRRAGASARHLRGPRLGGGDRLHQVARRDERRAAAGPHVRQRQPSRRARHLELLGLQQHRLLRARSALRVGSRRTACASSRRWSRAFTTPASR